MGCALLDGRAAAGYYHRYDVEVGRDMVLEIPKRRARSGRVASNVLISEQRPGPLGISDFDRR
jgi:hypothetical protein